MNAVEKKLKSKLKEHGHLKYPGCKVQAFLKGKKVVDISWGKTYPFYDLASLTKIIFTTLWFIETVQSRKMSLESQVQFHLPWYTRENIKIKNLLNHSAGNSWWQPFYKEINLALPAEQRFQQLEKFCQGAPTTSESKAVYSDIDFFLLGSVMQSFSQKPILENWNQLFETFFEKTSFHFNPQNKRRMSKALYAPTEICSWRSKTLQGEVHDENAWSLGGVAPHAGLFGSIDDLSTYGLLLRQGLYGNTQKIDSKVLKHFIKRSLPKERGDWGLGFMLPSEKNSSAGEHFSKTSFGHTGFTGTSFWFDPKKDLFVSILSNRVHPSRENRDFVSLRPMIHDWIVEDTKELQ